MMHTLGELLSELKVTQDDNAVVLLAIGLLCIEKKLFTDDEFESARLKAIHLMDQHRQKQSDSRQKAGDLPGITQIIERLLGK